MAQVLILQIIILFSGFRARIPSYEVIVQLHADVNPQSLANEGDYSYEKSLSQALNIHLYRSAVNERELFQLGLNPKVKHFELNRQLEFRAIPNDPEFDRQWTLERMGLIGLWDETTGGLTTLGDTIVVAITDNGFDVTHEDLAENIWRNHAEIPNDGLDNDNNGFIDDYTGWNFAEDQASHTADNHGTSVAGIIGARGNNGIGVSGVNWNVKLMLLDVGTTSDIISAYEYVIEQRRRYNESNGQEGAFVVVTNASLGLPTNSFCSEFPVWGGMYDQLGEVGILTAAGTSNRNLNVDVEGDMPTTCTSDFIISLLNVEMDDDKADNSSFGPNSIDLGVPGSNSYTTKPRDRYGSFGDNSAATPHLSGTIALMYSASCEEFASAAISDPQNTALEIRKAILDGVEQEANLENLTASGGILNAAQSYTELLRNCGDETSPPIGNILVYPNPANDILNIRVDLTSGEEVDLLLIDALGRIVF